MQVYPTPCIKRQNILFSDVRQRDVSGDAGGFHVISGWAAVMLANDIDPYSDTLWMMTNCTKPIYISPVDVLSPGVTTVRAMSVL